MILLHSKSFPHYGLDRFFEIASKAGYEGVEIMVSENFDTQNAAYIKTLEKRHNIQVRAFTITEKVTLNLLQGFVNMVREFPLVTLNLFLPQSFSFTYKKWFERTLPKVCQKYNLRLNYRNMPIDFMFGIIPKNSENSLNSLRERGNVCLDISAVWSGKQDVMRTISFLREKLKSVYLSNVDKNRPYSRLENGIMPIESFLTKLKQENYREDLVLGVSAKQLHEGDDEKMIQALKESKAFIERYFSDKETVA